MSGLPAATWERVLRASLQAFDVEGASPTWVLSNHDVIRHPTRYGGGEIGRERAQAATLTLLALPGSPYLYQGEELGLEQDDLPAQTRQDPIWVRSGGTVEGRDGCRTPMPWTSTPPGHGFTDGTPWLPLGEQARTLSVAAQTADATSTLSFYRRALAARSALRPELARKVRWLRAPADCLAFARSHATGGEVVCVLNTGEQTRELALDGEVVVASGAAAVDGGVLTVPARTAVWLRR